MFIGLSQELCIPLAGDKTEGPAQHLIFLGIELEMVALTSRLPVDKLVDLKEQILAFIRWWKELLKD